jgi:DMSO/TMAO reductase YedYZ molybdopterin-dependent catalytic subunit
MRLRAAWPWLIGGAAAAALAIGIGELTAALLNSPSIVASIGELVISLQPPGAKDLMVELFGEADKLALEVGVVVGGLLVGALLGLAARRDVRLATLGFGIFGLVAFLVVARDPLFEPLPAAITVLLAATSGALALPYLVPRPPALAAEPATAATIGRRPLLLSAAALSAGAVLAGIGRGLTAQAPAVAAPPITIPPPTETVPPPPAGASLDVPGLTPIVVPNDDFYRIDTRLTIPRLAAEEWTVRVHGMVDRETTLTYEQLAKMPLIERHVTIACVSNEVGGYLVGNAKWTGVRLVEVLDAAGVQAGATQVVGRSFDGWTAGFPTAHLAGAGADALIALKMNDEVLPARHGFPLRLIVPGLYGYVSATKWLSEIELTTLEAFDAYWVPLGWAKEAPILTQSRIEVPRNGAQVTAGPTVVAGVAWAPTRGISGVEVQADDGPWTPAQLSQPLSDAAWVQWQATIDLAAGTHRLRVRATDGSGALQEERRTPPAPDGARGWHTVQVSAG